MQRQIERNRETRERERVKERERERKRKYAPDAHLRTLIAREAETQRLHSESLVP